MQIAKKDQVPSIKKPHGTKIWYYIFPEHEIHFNEMPPHTIQPWHHHSKTDESIFVISGTLRVKWKESYQEHQADARDGSVVRIEHYVHTLENPTELPTTFVVFKFVPRDEDLHQLIKNDKVLD